MEVSVIVPVYNAAPWLADTVSSIVNQEYVHEVILSEDGSSDSLPFVRL